MKREELKNFDKEAAEWEQNPGRVKLAHDVADAIIKNVALKKNMDVLDFGCGTGLVTLRLQPLVRTITGADSSKGMLGVLESKVQEKKIHNVSTQFLDLEKSGVIGGTYDLIVSSMTLHHVPDTAALFRQWRTILKAGGLISFADLDTEDGSFHADKSGVFHFGFDRLKLKNLLQQSGFGGIHETAAATVVREASGIGKKSFSIFLITARKER